MMLTAPMTVTVPMADRPTSFVTLSHDGAGSVCVCVCACVCVCVCECVCGACVCMCACV